ncbi:hypothetical protein ACFPPA_06745 [Rhodanobacter ginsengisoli]|uniref:Aminoglycoside phosphotransferase domain-containing protein n=1 Tax=Rhodanobacter ginsengisoli TaxID=418646 RepID=A0ABW0QMC3_9GAMM
MSWLFFAGKHVYKLKKPFHHDIIDYRSPSARRRYCESEFRLNRRLAADVYLGVVPLTCDRAGRLALDGDGRPVDWLVKMQRLDSALTLESRLQNGSFDAADARGIIERLVPFFSEAARPHWTPAGYTRRLAKLVKVTAHELSRPEFGLDRARVDGIATDLRKRIRAHAGLLGARVREGRIVEGHGDLRPEHIYLTRPPTIIDCIEFDRALRLRDPIDELSFLAMECERLGEPASDGWLFDAYVELGDDDPARPLIEFHKAQNAFVRAKVAIWHLDDPDTGAAGPWVARANEYLRIARCVLARSGD